MLLSNLNLLATAPSGVARLRELILTLAVQGKLVPQDVKDEPASALLKKIRAEKDRLIAEGKIKRDKPLAEIDDDEKPFGLPKGWDWVRLGSLLDRLSNGYSGEQSKTSSPFPLTRIETISAASINYDRVGYCANLSQEEIEKYRLVTGDILLSHINSDIHLGKTAIVKDDRLLIHGTNLLLLRPSIFIYAAYVNLAITQRRFDGYFLSIAQHAIGQASINQSKLGATLVTLPPAAEQSRIATRVEELMRLCDALEAKSQLEAAQHAQLVSTLLATLTGSETPAQLLENWHRIATHFDLLLDRPEAVDALEQTILQLAVRGLLAPQDPQDEPASELLKKIRTEKDKLIAEGKIKRDKPLPPIAEDEQPFALPQGWEWCQLDELVTIRGGKRVSNGYQLLTVPTEFIYIRVSDMTDGSIDDSDLRYLDAQMHSAISRYIITKDDIYMTIVGATIGKCGLVPERFDGMNLTENAARLTPHLVSKDYLFGLLASEFCQEQFLGKTKQVGVQKVALNRLAGTLIPLPPLAEQSRIVTRVAQLRRLCADLRQRLSASQSTQAHLAEALISDLPA